MSSTENARAASIARAAKLRESIQQLRERDPGTPAPKKTPSSPREFVHEKMRELDKR